MNNKKPKIYRMNDQDTVIAYSKREAIQHYFDEGETGESKEDIAIECEQERKLSKGFWFICNKEDLWKRACSLNENDEFRVGAWSSNPAFYVTFQYVIDNLLNRVDIPCVICSTEY